MKIRLRKLHLARRFVQVLVVVFVLAAPALARYSNYIASRELDQNLEKWEGTLQGTTLAAIDTTLRALPGGEKERVGEMVRDRDNVIEYARELRGGPWSAEVGPISMTDPLAASESIIASRRLEKVLLISLIVPVLATVLLGRVFCSWICPMYLLLEITDKLRRVLRFLEVRPFDMKFSRWIKYTLLAVGLLLVFVISIPILGYIYPPAIIGRELHDFVFGLFDRAEGGQFGFWAGGLTWMSLVILAIVLFEITVSRRWWCRYVCPGGVLYSLLGIGRLVRVKRSEPKCTSCGVCISVCPEGLAPMKDQIGMECDNCGLCVSHCDDGALAMKLGLPGPGERFPKTQDAPTANLKAVSK